MTSMQPVSPTIAPRLSPLVGWTACMVAAGLLLVVRVTTAPGCGQRQDWVFSLLEVALTGAATWLAVKAIRVHRRWWRLLALLLLATVAAFGYMVFVGVWLLTTSCAVAV